ncbi:MAG: leucine-rich repeat domain-containing protein [Clostridium sp.]|nr:leucine-rich repeat domain-containing protein [Clostridium sp.]MCM1208215.1 leucine-rich repeat domain-containing protein [Ruminococcus sp.]
MKGKMKKIAAALLTVVISLCVLFDFSIPVKAADDTVFPTAADNLAMGGRKKSALVATDNGYMRVTYNWERISVEYYDDNFNILSKKLIDMELDIWGGFYAGEDAYYVVEGRNNTDENDEVEVIRVIKYDKNWNRMGAASITSNPDLFGGQVRYPFDSGCVEMEEYNGKLYIVTGHEGYVDYRVGQGHQGFLMIAVDTSAMTGEIVKSDLWHSFAQYIARSGSYLYMLEQSEGSRYTKLTQWDASKDILSLRYTDDIPVLQYGGERSSAWAIECYASVDDMAVSADNVLCLGTSIDQSQYDTVSDDTPHNIYLTVTPKGNFTEEATEVKWLTNHSNDGECFYGVNITRINDNRFIVAWEACSDSDGDMQAADDVLSTSVLHYVFVDGAGNKISSEYTAAAPISDCHPIVKGSKIVYCASNSLMVNFYTIDAYTGACSKRTYRVLGENGTWDLTNGVLTLKGTGLLHTEESYDRTPVSPASLFYMSRPGNPDWDAVRDNVTKIVVESGITSIPAKEFARFHSLTEVEIKNGLTSIGEMAFFNCRNLDKVTIPDSVTDIGEDIVWTGLTWSDNDQKVIFATIYGHEGSYAESYADDNDISFVSTPREVSATGIYCMQTGPSIVAGMVLEKSNVSDDIEYRWVACDESNPGNWFEISPWTLNNEWIDWTPDKSGNYVIVCYARIAGNSASEVSASFGTPYYKNIKGICQMPYEGEGGGYLIGFESYDNPDGAYRYEMLILDCTLLAQGLPAWTYTTGQCGVPENCLWTVWQPQYGYYWTLFRLYDGDGNLIDEVCYGFQNI